MLYTYDWHKLYLRKYCFHGESMEKNHKIIIALLVVIIVLLIGLIVSMQNFSNSNDVEVETNDTTTVINETTSEPEMPDSITVELPGFDTKYTKTVGEYTVEAEKWRGGSVGGFQVLLTKNGQLMDKNSYQSRAYFNDGSGWKWSNWDNGEEPSETLHKYPVANSVEIQEVEVTF